MIYRVKHDTNVYRPIKWTGEYVRRFGENNKGFLVDARDMDHLIEHLKTKHNLNPFYLKITKEVS